MTEFASIAEGEQMPVSTLILCDGLIINTLQFHFPFLPAGITFKGK